MLHAASTSSGNTENPFAAHAYYVNDIYRNRVHKLMSAPWVDQQTNGTLLRMASMGSAFWIDSIQKIHGEGVTLELVLSDAATQPVPPLVCVILYKCTTGDRIWAPGTC
jgi:outer membrane scaffolding protein for murein synthesis (MipA/OmpV family)